MASLTNAQYKSIFDTILHTKMKFMEQGMIKRSKVLERLMRPKDVLTGATSISGIPVEAYGRSYKINLDPDYTINTTNKGQYNIEMGDEKRPTMSKNLQQAEITAVDKGFTIGITTADLQRVSAGTGDSQSQKFANYVEKHWQKRIDGFTISLVDSIWNGLGASGTDDLGATKPDFIGIHSDGTNGIVGSASYGGKTITDAPEWQSKAIFSMNDSILGYTSTSSFDTVAHLTTVATGALVTPFYDVLDKMRRRIQIYNQQTSKKNLVCVMSAPVYDFLFLPSIAANRSVQVMSPSAMSKGEQQQVSDDGFTIGGMPILVEDTMLPSDDKGSNPVFIYPQDYIYFINFDAINLIAEAKNNFTLTDFEAMPNQYNVAQKSMSTTLVLFADKRICHGSLRIPTAINTLLTTSYGTL